MIGRDWLNALILPVVGPTFPDIMRNGSKIVIFAGRIIDPTPRG